MLFIIMNYLLKMNIIIIKSIHQAHDICNSKAIPAICALAPQSQTPFDDQLISDHISIKHNELSKREIIISLQKRILFFLLFVRICILHRLLNQQYDEFLWISLFHEIAILQCRLIQNEKLSIYNWLFLCDWTINSGCPTSHMACENINEQSIDLKIIIGIGKQQKWEKSMQWLIWSSIEKWKKI